MVQWLELCTAKLQPVGLNPHYTYVYKVCFPAGGVLPWLAVSGVTNVGAKLFNSTLIVVMMLLDTKR